MTDPFATAATRDRVLAAWSASPVRFREDANAEEDLALGGYRDRLVVELAQNAADAAARAGVPGRMRLTLRDDPQTRAESGGPVLIAANTGAPLSTAGVEALATLRASAKRDESPTPGPDSTPPTSGLDLTVGRFGVGFAAVLAVTDEPTIVSRTGGVRFSRDDTAALVAEAGEAAPGLAAEQRRRDGHVPVLRLPFAADGEPPEGFDTAVLLPLRDEAAADLVRRLLAEADDALLLALPHLDRIEIDPGETGRADAGRADARGGGEDGDGVRVLTGVGERWHAHRASGVWTPAERAELLADRPTEERSRPSWTVLWALSRTPTTVDPFGGPSVTGPSAGGAGIGARSGDLPAVVHAPTPTDEPLSLPAMLLASFPLDPTRRHVAEGPLTDRLVEEAARAYADLAHTRAEAGESVIHLVPVGLPAGRLDGAIREAILRRLPDTPLLRTVEDHTLIRARDAVVVEGADDEVVRALAPLMAGLVAERRGDRAAHDALGVRRLSLADIVEELSGVAAAHPPEWWRDFYAALGSTVADPVRREALGALSVPLADGRIVRGARGLLLPDEALGLDTHRTAADGGLSDDALGLLASSGLRLVHPQAATGTAAGVLERLGAQRAGPRVLLEDGAVQAAVHDAAESDDPTVAEGVLALVAAATSAGELSPGELPWLGELLLSDAGGHLAAANALVLPGSEAEAVLDPEEFTPVAAELLDRWGPDVLEAVGVARTLGVVTASDVHLDVLPDELAELDDIDAWAGETLEAASSAGDDRGPGEGGGPAAARIDEVVAVRDLDFVRDDAWPRTLRLLAGERATRRALTEQVRVHAVARPDRAATPALSYTAWWLRRHVRIDGVPLTDFADPDADPAVAALLTPPPGWVAELDTGVRRALGLVGRIADLDPTGIHTLLDRLSDPSLEVSATTMLALWAQFADLAPPTDDARPTPPRQVRVLTDPATGASGTRVVDSSAAVVVDGPMWMQRTDLGGQVVAPGAAAERLADLLDLPLASEAAAGAVDDDDERAEREVPEAARILVPGVPTRWWEHDDLRVDGQEVDWWVDEGGAAHAATGEGLARALAHAAARWDQRHALTVILLEPDRLAELLTESAYDEARQVLRDP
ncbi:hypothetical protein [Actinopolymorpha sp. B9G3]|uniref:sacsin N-terminal ATP-binding-like domain-containing protein n=1 Tax=Actinopolymorpha sp. B9G3 TaxID=3158970 RepID=UPI0032D9129B